MCLGPSVCGWKGATRTWVSESGSSQLTGHTCVSLGEKAQASVSKPWNHFLAPCIVPLGGGFSSRGIKLYAKGMEEAGNPQQW